MGVFGRAWEFTKLSFGVIKKDKELLLYPLLSSIITLIFSAATVVPFVVVKIVQEINAGGDFDTVTAALGITEYIIVFVYYLGLALIGTFFSVCVVYTAKERFAGRNATFGSSLKFAFSKFHLIFLWSLLSATVGLIFYILDQIAQNLGKGGEIVVQILRSILGMLWSIMTIFVVPAMVFYGLSPFKAIKKSNQTLRKTWGESIIRHYGLGLIQFLVILVGIIVAGVLFFLFSGAGLTAILIIVGAFVLYVIIVSLVFQVANQVFNTALFIYADKGRAPTGYSSSSLKSAMKVKQAR